MRTTLFWVITQREVVIPYRRFGTTYRSRIQESRIQIFLFSSNLRRKPEVTQTKPNYIFLAFCSANSSIFFSKFTSQSESFVWYHVACFLNE